MQRVKTISGRLCESCGIPLHDEASCASCSIETLPLKIRSYAWYQEPLRRVLVKLKYLPDKRLSGWLADRLVDIVRREAWPKMTVVPVPLSRKKYNRRGYNQVDLVASIVAQKLEWPYQAKALRRIKDTQSQVGLSLIARSHNVRGAFQAEYQVKPSECFLLVDDLLTSGATLLACSHALIDAGAKDIYAVTIARAEHKYIAANTKNPMRFFNDN
jgi:ComF family protein